MFSPSDYADPDIYERLRALSMVKINKNILTKFSSLSLKEQRLANLELNKYIRESLGGTDWKDTLINDFNMVANEEVFQNPKFDYAKVYVPPSNQPEDEA